MNIKRITVTVLALALVFCLGTGALAGGNKSGKLGTSMNIDAVAAQVLRVPEASIAGLNHAGELYAELEDAGKVDEFKAALIESKREMIQTKMGTGKISSDKLAQIIASYTKTIEAWDGSDELSMGFSKAK